jgi:hypothetical protein
VVADADSVAAPSGAAGVPAAAALAARVLELLRGADAVQGENQ